MEVRNNENLTITKDAKEIIKSFQKFQNLKTSESANEFVNLLLIKIDPERQPKFGTINSLEYILTKGGTINFGTGTLGDRIHFSNNNPLSEIDEPLDGPVKYMVYPSSDATFSWQKSISQKWQEIFGSDRVDLGQKIE